MTKLKALLSILGVDETVLNSEDTRLLYDAFMTVEDTKNALENFGQLLRGELFTTIEKDGIWDDKGSCTVTFPDGKWVKKEARTTISLNLDRVKTLAQKKNLPLVMQVPEIPEENMEDAIQFLLTHNPSVVTFTEKPDEDRIQQFYVEHLIGDRDLADVIDKKINYALKKSK